MKILRLVKPDEVGMRLDRFIDKKYDIASNTIQKLIRERKIRVNDCVSTPFQQLQENDRISISNYPAFEIQPHKEENFLNLRGLILFENEDLFAINKPSGVAVHQGLKIPWSLEDHFHREQFLIRAWKGHQTAASLGSRN